MLNLRIFHAENVKNGHRGLLKFKNLDLGQVYGQDTPGTPYMACAFGARNI